jgi:3-oxoacyl-[acyl-carrier-protein] synthase II
MEIAGFCCLYILSRMKWSEVVLLERRVVITGVGAVTPIGKTKEDYWKNLLKGNSGVRVVKELKDNGYASHIAAVVEDFNPEEYMEKRDVRKMDRYTHFAIAAASMALRDASLDPDKIEDKDRVGVIIGSGIGGICTIEEQIKILVEKGPRRVSPFFVPSMIANMASGYVSIVYGLRGPNTTLVTACASGTHALGEAFHTIRRGDTPISPPSARFTPGFFFFLSIPKLGTCFKVKYTHLIAT